jgi:hypothetical protein
MSRAWLITFLYTDKTVHHEFIPQVKLYISCVVQCLKETVRLNIQENGALAIYCCILIMLVISVQQRGQNSMAVVCHPLPPLSRTGFQYMLRIKSKLEGKRFNDILEIQGALQEIMK